MDLPKYLSLIILIIANLVPLYGVYVWGWSITELILLYWSESAIICFFSVLKMAMIRRPQPAASPPPALKMLFLLLFIGQYGAFLLAYLALIITFFVKDFSISLLLSVLIGTASLLISHGASFVTNYVWNKEYERAFWVPLMLSPYFRIMLMQFVVFIGALINAPLITVVAGKIIMDVLSRYAVVRFVPR